MNNKKIREHIQGLRDLADEMEKELPEAGYTMSQLKDGTAPEGVYRRIYLKESDIGVRWIVLKNKKGDIAVLYALPPCGDIWPTQNRGGSGHHYCLTNETFHWEIKEEA
jgi:hypothetical protein